MHCPITIERWPVVTGVGGGERGFHGKDGRSIPKYDHYRAVQMHWNNILFVRAQHSSPRAINSKYDTQILYSSNLSDLLQGCARVIKSEGQRSEIGAEPIILPFCCMRVHVWKRKLTGFSG